LVVDRVRGMRRQLQAPCLSRTRRRARAGPPQQGSERGAAGTTGSTAVAMRYTGDRSRTPPRGLAATLPRVPAPGTSYFRSGTSVTFT
jgi:hypothetical protein